MNWKADLLEDSPVQHDQWHSWPDVASLHDGGEHVTLLQPWRLQVRVWNVFVLALNEPGDPPTPSWLTPLVVSPQIPGDGLRAWRGDAGHPAVPVCGAKDDVCQRARLHSQRRLLSLSAVWSAQRQQLSLRWVCSAALPLGSSSMQRPSLELDTEIEARSSVSDCCFGYRIFFFCQDIFFWCERLSKSF